MPLAAGLMQEMIWVIVVPPPGSVAGVIQIPFSIRETTAVTVFASHAIAADLLKMGKVYPITLLASTIGQIALVRAQLFSTYRQLIHQDVPNQHAVLETLCLAAQSEIETLTALVAGIPVTAANVQSLKVLNGRMQSYQAMMFAVMTHF